MTDRDCRTVPPGGDPIDDPEHQAIVERIENGLSKRFSDTLARQGALETVVREQAETIRALGQAIRAGHSETLRGQAEILDAVAKYFNEMGQLVTRIDQLGTRVEKLEHEHGLNHTRLNGSLPPNCG